MNQKTYQNGLTKTHKLEHDGIVLEFESVPTGYAYTAFLPDVNKQPYRVLNGFFGGHDLGDAIDQAQKNVLDHIDRLSTSLGMFTDKTQTSSR